MQSGVSKNVDCSRPDYIAPHSGLTTDCNGIRKRTLLYHEGFRQSRLYFEPLQRMLACSNDRIDSEVNEEESRSVLHFRTLDSSNAGLKLLIRRR